MSDQNFWNGNSTSKNHVSHSKNHDSAKNTKITEVEKSSKNRVNDSQKHNYGIWYCFAAIGLVLLLAAAIIINNNLGSEITASQVSGSLDIDNGDTKINWDRYDTFDVALSETFTITMSGTYHLTGTLNDGAIIINASGAKVRLILDNATIKNSSGPAILCYSADDLVIELVGDNYIEDGKTYSSNYEEEVTGAIYSKDDLSFTGDGSLTVVANYQDGIVGKDDVKFNSGSYVVTAADDGIRGTDSVYVVSGDFDITATGDGIKSTNETTVGKGFVLIENGNFSLNTTAKGIKATNSILIYDGQYDIISRDDSIHSNSYIGIEGGVFSIASGDDGIHADKTLIIDGGEIVISKSYEGVEAQAITINGGDISITSSDDGMNAGGGADASATNRPGAGTFDSDTNCILSINGGNIYVNASGDGIDSNGYLYFNGGTVIVDGPTTNGNGALDSGVGIVQSGGTVLAIGSSGMAVTLGNTSTVYNASIYLSASQSAGTQIEIKNSAGDTIVSHTSAKTFNHISVGTPEFQNGETYTLYLNGAEYTTFTISDVTTTVGNTAQNFNQMNNRR